MPSVFNLCKTQTKLSHFLGLVGIPGAHPILPEDIQAYDHVDTGQPVGAHWLSRETEKQLLRIRGVCGLARGCGLVAD